MAAPHGKRRSASIALHEVGGRPGLGVEDAIVACLPFFLAVVLTACGGEGPSDEEVVQDLVIQTTTERDPDTCDLFSESYLSANYDTSGPPAVALCKQLRASDDDVTTADDVRFGETTVDGSRASVEGTLVGGSYDGETFRTVLVNHDGEWLVDDIKGIILKGATLNRFLVTYEDRLGTLGVLSDSQTACVLRRVKRAVVGDDLFEISRFKGAGLAERAFSACGADPSVLQ